jgi:hypothetical protein
MIHETFVSGGEAGASRGVNSKCTIPSGSSARVEFRWARRESGAVPPPPQTIAGITHKLPFLARLFKQDGARRQVSSRSHLALTPTRAAEICRTRRINRTPSSHIPPILPTHVIQRMTDLPQAMRLHRFHQRGEDVLAGAGGGLEEG